MPVYAIVFGDVMGVFMNEDPDDVRAEGNKYSLYFLIIGIVTGIAMFFQVYLNKDDSDETAKSSFYRSGI